MSLKFLDNGNNTEPHLNLAIEEFAVRNTNPADELLFLYRNEPSVVVGKHQNIYEELNVEIALQQKIPVLRRISGGGTVVHDLGNLNFSFITRYSAKKFNQYREFTAPIIKTLREFGVPAYLNERNDIMIDDFKISGNAQFTSRERMLSHGTLLFDSDLARLKNILSFKPIEISSKSRKSLPSEVTNISAYLRDRITLGDFQNTLLKNIFNNRKFPVYQFSEKDWEQIKILAEEKYQSWEWNFAQSPDFSVRLNLPDFKDSAALKITVEKGRIQKIESDLLQKNSDLLSLNQVLKNVRFMKSDLKLALQQHAGSPVFKLISPENLIDAIF